MPKEKPATNRSKKSEQPSKVKNWKVQSVLKRMDLFGADLPMFNLKGDTQVRS